MNLPKPESMKTQPTCYESFVYSLSCSLLSNSLLTNALQSYRYCRHSGSRSIYCHSSKKKKPMLTEMLIKFKSQEIFTFL